MIYPIVKFPDPILQRASAPVTEFNDELRTLVADMFESMYAAQGIGLAAPQIGIPKRITVIDLSNKKEPKDKIVLINPEITLQEGKQLEEEGCLSLPEIREKVRRSARVVVKAQDEYGKWKEYEGTELLARAFQHEIDHLDGVLFIFRISALKRDLALRRIKKMQRARRVVESGSKMRLVFCGTPAFAVPTLHALLSAGHSIELVLCQPDRPSGRGLALTAPPVKRAALDARIEVLQPEKIRNNTELQARLEAIGADAIIVVAYGRLIPRWMLDLPRYGNLNLHGSLLPKYRGAAPIQWAVANGETVTGVTTMRLDEGMDTGGDAAAARAAHRPHGHSGRSFPAACRARRASHGGNAGGAGSWNDPAAETGQQPRNECANADA